MAERLFPISEREKELVPLEIIESLDALISTRMSSSESMYEINRAVDVDTESGWTELLYEVKLGASLRDRHSLWDDLCNLVDNRMDQLPVSQQHYREIIGVVVSSL